MRLSEWMMRFLALGNRGADVAAAVLSAVIRRDEETLERVYEKLSRDKMDA